MIPRVLDEFTTLRAIVDKRLSLARIGDGEWKLMCGRDCRSHDPNPALAQRLREVAWAGSDGRVLVAIPRIYDGIPPHKVQFWTRYATPERARFYDASKMYHSQFVTRLDFFPELDCPEFWALWRAIWDGCRVLYVKGGTPRVPELLDNALGIDVLAGPAREAWGAYPALLADCRAWSAANPDGVITLCLGPAATVMAYELGQLGIQTIDLGRAPNFYAHRSMAA